MLSSIPVNEREELKTFCKVNLPSLCMESSENRHCPDASPSHQTLQDEKMDCTVSFISCIVPGGFNRAIDWRSLTSGPSTSVMQGTIFGFLHRSAKY